MHSTCELKFHNLAVVGLVLKGVLGVVLTKCIVGEEDLVSRVRDHVVWPVDHWGLHTRSGATDVERIARLYAVDVDTLTYFDS